MWVVLILKVSIPGYNHAYKITRPVIIKRRWPIKKLLRIISTILHDFKVKVTFRIKEAGETDKRNRLNRN